jgi:hypothetical protein
VALEQKMVFPSTDPRLDWVSKHDTRSLNYLIRPRLGEVVIQPRLWRPGPTLDQKAEGACVGFGWTQELMTSPRPYPGVTVEKANEYARGYYRETLQNDEFPGEEDEGTSVNAGAQTAKRRGFIESYYWCMSLEDVRDALIEKGPVVIGIPWYYEMYETKESGLIEVGGPLAGGHCLLLDEYHPGKRLRGENYHERFEVYGSHNSWGESYGNNGRGYFRAEILRDLLAHWGEACVPEGRKLVRF